MREELFKRKRVYNACRLNTLCFFLIYIPKNMENDKINNRINDLQNS